MAKVPFEIVGDFQKVKQRGINPETTLNLYAVNMQDQKTSPALVCTQGTKFAVKFRQGSRIRALYADLKNNNLYAVCSQFVYRLDINLNPIPIGMLSTTTGIVKIAQNNANQIFFTDSKDGFIYNSATNVFEIITASGFPVNPQGAEFMDTYFITAEQGTNNWFISGQNDGTAWDPLDTAQLQTRADNIVSAVVLKRQLFIFGERTTEIWVDQGALNFPFVRDNTVVQLFNL